MLVHIKALRRVNDFQNGSLLNYSFFQCVKQIWILIVCDWVDFVFARSLYVVMSGYVNQSSNFVGEFGSLIEAVSCNNCCT